MSENRATICVLCSGILWGSICVFSRALSAYSLSVEETGLLRSGFSAILLLIILIISKPSLLIMSLRELPIFICSGFLSQTMFNRCYLTTIKNGGASIAACLLYTSPVFVMVFSVILFKERLTGRKIAALIVSVTGCMMLSGFLAPGRTIDISVFMTGLGAGFFYSLYSLIGRFALKKYHPYTYMVYTFIFGSIGTALSCSFHSMGKIVDHIGEITVWGIGFAVFATILPYMLYTQGLRWMETGKAAVLATTELFAGALFGVCLFKESLDFGKITGMLLIFTAVALLNIPKRIFATKRNRGNKAGVI